MVTATRQASLPPAVPGSPTTAKSRQGSVEPSSLANVKSQDAAARARSVSVEPESLKTPKAKSPEPEAPGAPSRDPSVEPSSTNDSEPASASVIDMETFEQILELDDEDDVEREFSRGMTFAYFAQAVQTFVDMDKALVEKDLPKLSSLGHFLKGSSAALGVSKVQASCEKIQHYGQLRDEEANTDLSAKDALAKIGSLLGTVKLEYAEAEKVLKKYYPDIG